MQVIAETQSCFWMNSMSLDLRSNFARPPEIVRVEKRDQIAARRFNSQISGTSRADSILRQNP